LHPALRYEGHRRLPAGPGAGQDRSPSETRTGGGQAAGVRSDRAEPGGPSFALTKWYLDVVDAAGRVFVGYWAALGGRGLAPPGQSVALYEPGRPPLRRSGLPTAPPPEIAPGVFRFRAPALDCAMEVEPRQPPFEARLFDDGAGAVEWRVEAPAA